MTDDYDDDWDSGDCWNCDGEGFVSDCFDGCCIDADYGCELCTRRCWVCNPGKPNPELQQVLAEALAENEAKP